MTLVAEGKAAEIERIIAEPAEALGYRLVRIQLSGANQIKLQVMAERSDGGMTLDDCARLSRSIGALLDVENPIAAPYILEVSSPGIDRPLTRPDDFQRFAGFEAKIEVRLPLDGRRRFRGRLLGLEGERVRLQSEDREVALDLSEIAKAKLVLTDDLIAASRGPAPN